MKKQGFKVNPHLQLETNDKNSIRKLHQIKKSEQIKQHNKFILKNFEKVKKHSLSAKEIDPTQIDLELIEVKSNSNMYNFFLWWNLVWWSLPYTHPIGRQMRYLLWDKHHDAPFGLFLLQSPPLRSGTRDKFLGLNSENISYWINQSMYGQRIGALPPYNGLLGAKMVSLSLTSNEVRKRYEEKYEKKVTLLKQRVLPNNLLFITTTSAYGRSRVYDNIKYENQDVSKFIGFTAGSGTFHVSEEMYQKLLAFLENKGYNVKRGYGTGPSRKLKLIDLAFRKLGLKKFSYHKVKRGYYLFSNVSNLLSVISENENPQYHNRPFEELSLYWKNKMCIPRSKRTKCWTEFNAETYFNQVATQIDNSFQS